MKTFRIVIQFNQFEIYIKLVAKMQYTGTVRICSCIIPVTFTMYLGSVIIHSCLNCVTVVMVDCSSDALQLIRGSL